MTFEEFMKLEKWDGVIVDGRVGTITNLINIAKSGLIGDFCITSRALQAMRQMEISFCDEYTGRIKKCYAVIYTEYPDEVHNRSVLARLQGSHEDIALPAVKKVWREALAEVVPAAAGDSSVPLWKMPVCP